MHGDEDKLARIVMQEGTKWRMRLVVGIGAQQRKAGRAKR